jgi:hypothetical protein
MGRILSDFRVVIKQVLDLKVAELKSSYLGFTEEIVIQRQYAQEFVQCLHTLKTGR